MFSSLHEKFLKRGSNREQSVGPLLPFLSAWESEPVSLSSYLGVRLNLGLATGKGALLRSKVSGEAPSWPFHPSRPWLWSRVSLLCGWCLWNYPWLQPTPLIFYISAMASAVSSSRLSWPLAVALWLAPPPSCPSSKRSFLSSELIAPLSTSSVAPNTEDWRPYVATLCPLHPDPKSPFQNYLLPTPVPDPLVTLKFLLQWGSPISAVLRLFLLPAGPFSPFSTWWNPAEQVSPCSCEVLLIPHAHPGWLTPFPCTPVALLACDCVLCTLSCPPYQIKPPEGERVLYLLSKGSGLGAECMARPEKILFEWNEILGFDFLSGKILG